MIETVSVGFSKPGTWAEADWGTCGRCKWWRESKCVGDCLHDPKRGDKWPETLSSEGCAAYEPSFPVDYVVKEYTDWCQLTVGDCIPWGLSPWDAQEIETLECQLIGTFSAEYLGQYETFPSGWSTAYGNYQHNGKDYWREFDGERMHPWGPTPGGWAQSAIRVYSESGSTGKNDTMRYRHDSWGLT